MTLSGTRGLVRVSKNPACELQAAMAVERVREPDFFRAVTGAEYPKEYGERVAARRRGSRFETRLHENNAAELRRVLGEHLRVSADAMVVRNFAEEVPGPPTTMRAARLVRTRRVLADLAAGREVPDVLIQPQLALPTGEGGRAEYVSPDFFVLDPRTAMYKPGEEKSFIVRDNRADGADLDLTRRQAAAQILALRHEAALVGLADRVAASAIFVMATPFGLRAAPAVEEDLDAAIVEIERAVAIFDLARRRLTELRAGQQVVLAQIVDELATAPQETCHQSCVMSSYCFRRAGDTPNLLGDAAARLLGDIELERACALLAGAVAPADDVEEDLVAALAESGRLLGVETDELRRRLA